jgi:hypothetical protein
MRFLIRSKERPLERFKNSAWARAASQPMAGQSRTSDLATKLAGVQLASENVEPGNVIRDEQGSRLRGGTLDA